MVQTPGESGFFDEGAELVEEDGGIVRAGGGFGMVLDAVDGLGFMAHALDGLVVEVDAVDGDVAGQAVSVDGEPVILGGDFDFAGFEVFDGLIGATVTEF